MKKLVFSLALVTMSLGMALLPACAASTPTPTASATATTTVPAVTPTPTSTPTPSVTAAPKPANPQLIMSSTTSTRDSGLMDVLIPIFQQQTGYIVKAVYNGTGAAIAMGTQGNADVLLVHAPSQEVAFMATGAGLNRRLVMHNDFIIVGSTADPAGIKGMTSAVDALKKIAAAGATFYSRGDNSGTDTIDKTLWGKAGVTVKDGAATNPSWYVEGGAGTGMLDLDRVAQEKGGYTITDRATYVANLKTLSGLAIMVQGDPGLLNIYHVIQVNPAKFPNVNAAGAQAFSDFMVAPATQAIIAKYGIDQYGQALFFPDAGKTEASLGSQ